MTKLQELREAIIARNPKKGGRAFKNGPIGLAEVLVALKAKDTHATINIDTFGNIWNEYRLICEWDLTKDLDNQSEKTILALLELINREVSSD